MQAAVLVLAVIFVLVNLAVDHSDLSDRAKALQAVLERERAVPAGGRA